MSEQATSTSNNEPKFYKGGKSKALRALKSIGEHAAAAADKLLFPSPDGSYGFYPLDARAAQDAGLRNAAEAAATFEQSHPQAEELHAEHIPGEVNHFKVELPAGPANEDSVETEESVPEAEEPAAAADAEVFGAALLSQLTTNAAAAPAAPAAPVARAASRTSYTIEKNRPEQNGIKRPSQGGLCRAVWDACDDLRAQLNNGDRDGTLIPDSKQIKAVADGKGWNRNNAMIEFYQWRRFNGITGRSAAAKVEAQQPQNAPEMLPGTPAAMLEAQEQAAA
jgi:hypothetical protein